MAQVKFAYGTKARYDALAPKDMDTLYFTTDTLQLFKGTTEYTKSTKMVSALPAAGQVQGVIYFRMTDYTMHIWNGVEFVQLNKKTITQIPADATNDDIPTTKAVADYVQAKVAAVEGIKGKFVTDVTYNAGVLSVAKGDEPVTTTMTGIVHEPTYDAETRTIKLPVFGGDNTTYGTFKAATASAAGGSGLVPAPAAGKQGQYLRGDGTWSTPTNTTYSDATQSTHGLMSTSDKKKLDGFGAANTYALKSDITAMYRYKGSVASTDKLPTSGQTIGDVYDVGNGMNYAWNGSKWDALGEIFTITKITNTEIDNVLAS